MAAKSPSLAKLTPPSLPRVLDRPRLYRELDAARKRPIVWVTGPAGSGKTTLVASYLRARRVPTLWYRLDTGDAEPATLFHYLGLAARRVAPRQRTRLPHATPEYWPALEIFARRFFEDLFARLEPSSVLVFEDYHEVPDDAPFHRLLRVGLDAVPEGVGVLLVSRGAPHRAHGSLRARRWSSTVGAEALRLTRNEIGKLAALQLGRRGLPSAHELDALHRRTRGWAAGAVLLLAHARSDAEDARTEASEALFDYLASEVLNAFDAETQTALIKTAVLPSMSASMAAAVSGLSDAGDVLARLHRDRYFTERRPGGSATYQYHPLFREFLLAQGERRLARPELRRIHEDAARLCEAASLVEDAGALFRAAERFDELARLVCMHAPRLLGEGRSGVVEHWLGALPAALVAETPWLSFWQAACRLPVSPADAERHYVSAFERFVRDGDRAGALLAWCGIVDAIWFAWTDVPSLDGWLDRFAELMPDGAPYPSPAIEAAVACAMFNALFWRRPVRSSVLPWAAKATAVLEAAPAFGAQHAVTAIALMNFYWQAGDVAPAAHVADVMQRALRRRPGGPIAEAARLQGEAVLAAVLGDAERCARTVAHGLEIAQRDGALLWVLPLAGVGCLGALSVGDLPAARSHLDLALAHAEGALVLRSWILILQSRFALASGDVPRAIHAAATSLRLTAREGPFPEVLSRLAMTHALHAAGRTREALEQLARTEAIVSETESGMLELGWRMAAALIALDERRDADCDAHLRAAFAIGAATGVVEWQGGLRPQELARLCARALDAGIDPDYARNLVRKRRLATDPAASNAAWPWPLKIYTLGRFAVLKDGKPVTFGRKAQRRPIDLLKAVIALGGRDVSQARVIEALWPDADGDAAVAAMNMALKRLRELLGDPAAIVLAGRKITLDAGRCWVDVWSLERALGKNAGAGDGLADADALLSLYRGPFLQSDDEPWAHAPRERLRDKTLARVREIGVALEARGELAAAVLCYRHGLRIDDLAEELYQRLMLCHDGLGQRGEALAAYRRCKRALAMHGGAVPSAKTERIYRQVLASEN